MSVIKSRVVAASFLLQVETFGEIVLDRRNNGLDELEKD